MLSKKVKIEIFENLAKLNQSTAVLEGRINGVKTDIDTKLENLKTTVTFLRDKIKGFKSIDERMSEFKKDVNLKIENAIATHELQMRRRVQDLTKRVEKIKLVFTGSVTFLDNSSKTYYSKEELTKIVRDAQTKGLIVSKIT